MGTGDTNKRAEGILEAAALQWGERPLVVDPTNSYSYRELLSSAYEVASFLQSRGVAAGSVVGFSASDARCFIPLLFGILRADCVALPISPHLSIDERELHETTADVAATLTVSRETCAAATSLTLPGPSHAAFTRRAQTRHNKVRAAFPSAAVMRFTSGTTSTAKGVVLSHAGILARTATCQQIIEVTRDDRVLSPLPLSYHFIASAMSFIRAGATILDSAGLEGSAFALFTHANAPTLAYAAPTHYQTLYDHLVRTNLGSLRKAISASEPLRPEMARLFESRFNLRLIQAYGIIEVGLPLWNDNSRWSPGDLGLVKAPYEGRLVDGSNDSETHGSVGELAVRGPGLFSGYVLHSGEIRTHTSNEWFLTGDIVARATDGTLSFKGRKQSRIVIDDQHIYPEEIEAVLKRSSEIVEARVSIERDPIQGERLIAEIVSRDQTSSSFPSWLKLCEETLPTRSRPKEFRVVAAIPSTGSGKVIRRSAL